jgi:DNA-binding transcriptional LysR family regulator
MGLTMNEVTDSRHLQVFVAVARSSNMRRAAKDLHLTPSAVSHVLRAFEEALGCQLFERTTRRVMLSRDGARLLPEAQSLLESLANLNGFVQAGRDWRQGRLRLGASPTACQYLLPAVIREFKESFPDVAIQITQGSPTTLVQNLLDGVIDLSLSPQTPEHRALACVDLAQDELAFVVNPLHPWAQAKQVNRAEIARQRFVMAESNSFTKRLIDDYFRQEGIAIQPFIEIGNEEVIKELVRLDLGVGILPLWIASEEVETGLLVSLPLGRKAPGRKWVACHRVNQVLSFSEMLFLGFSRAVAFNRIGSA